MPKGDTGLTINEIAEMLKTICVGNCTIALSGSHAKGLADEYSDIDIIVYFENPKPYETLKLIVESFADNQSAMVPCDHVSAHWGGLISFDYKGTFVEVTTRFYENTMKYINDCIEGHIEVLPAEWSINGFYTFTYISEISYVKPIWDPSSFIDNTQKLINPYPKKLKKAILDTFGARMRATLNSDHYKIMIKRRDMFVVQRCIQLILLNMAQVINALNETYFTGDKHTARKLAKLPYCPSKLLDNLGFLMSSYDNVLQMERQRNLLLEIADELNAKCDGLTC